MHSGAALANELGERLREQTVFCLAATRANPICPRFCANVAHRSREAVAYRTVTPVNLDNKGLLKL